jgi:hypothetical protein
VSSFGTCGWCVFGVAPSRRVHCPTPAHQEIYEGETWDCPWHLRRTASDPEPARAVQASNTGRRQYI